MLLLLMLGRNKRGGREKGKAGLPVSASAGFTTFAAQQLKFPCSPVCSQPQGGVRQGGYEGEAARERQPSLRCLTLPFFNCFPT